METPRRVRFRGSSRRRASSRRSAQELDYRTQLTLMKRHAPRLKPTQRGWLVEVFSPVIGHYMEMMEWKLFADAVVDKESWDESHVWTLERLRDKVREQRAQGRMAALLR